MSGSRNDSYDKKGVPIKKGVSKCSAHLFLLTSTDNYNQDSLLLMVHLDILSTERTSTAYSVVGIDVQESAFSSELSVNAIGSINIFHPDITIFIMDKDELLSRNGNLAGSRIVDSIDGFTTVPKICDLDIGRTSIDKFDSYFVSISCRIIICAIIDSSVSAVQIIDRSGRKWLPSLLRSLWFRRQYRHSNGCSKSLLLSGYRWLS